MTISFRMTFAVAAAAFVTGCASTPEVPAPLQEARTAYNAAQTNPDVPRLAPAELNQAGRSLNEAERAWREDAGNDIVAHQAYLAAQSARIALNAAKGRAARAEIERAEVERRNVVAEAESRQAQAAREQATRELKQTQQELAQSEEAQRQARLAQQQAEQARQQAELAEQTMRKELQALQAQRTDRGWVVTLGSDVLFDVGQATLKPGAHRAVENLTAFLRNHPEQNVVIEGHTDSTGSNDFNLELSRERAQTVKQAIVRAGIDARRIEVRGRGEGFPVASNDTGAGRQLNRRVEVLIPQTADGGATGVPR